MTSIISFSAIGFVPQSALIAAGKSSPAARFTRAGPSWYWSSVPTRRNAGIFCMMAICFCIIAGSCCAFMYSRAISGFASWYRSRAYSALPSSTHFSAKRRSGSSLYRSVRALRP